MILGLLCYSSCQYYDRIEVGQLEIKCLNLVILFSFTVVLQLQQSFSSSFKLKSVALCRSAFFIFLFFIT